MCNLAASLPVSTLKQIITEDKLTSLFSILVVKYNNQFEILENCVWTMANLMEADSGLVKYVAEQFGYGLALALNSVNQYDKELIEKTLEI